MESATLLAGLSVAKWFRVRTGGAGGHTAPRAKVLPRPHRHRRVGGARAFTTYGRRWAVVVALCLAGSPATLGLGLPIAVAGERPMQTSTWKPDDPVPVDWWFCPLWPKNRANPHPCASTRTGLKAWRRPTKPGRSAPKPQLTPQNSPQSGCCTKPRRSAP